MSLIENLKAARALIDTPEKWLQGAYEIDKCYCASGAVRMIDSGSALGDLGDTHYALRAALPFGYTAIPDYNDDPRTTHVDIMTLFDRAIAAAERSVAAEDDRLQNSRTDASRSWWRSMTATPQQLRTLAAQHRRNWQTWWVVDPRSARDELAIARDLERLADEAEQWRMAA